MFKSVKETKFGYEAVLEDDVKISIPKDTGNRHFQAIAKWLETLGNIILPMDPDPVLTYRELRSKEYLAQGITTEALAVATWEKAVENRPQAADDLQAKRAAIKTMFPKS